MFSAVRAILRPSPIDCIAYSGTRASFSPSAPFSGRAPRAIGSFAAETLSPFSRIEEALQEQ
jgi:hypothetical protein